MCFVLYVCWDQFHAVKTAKLPIENWIVIAKLPQHVLKTTFSSEKVTNCFVTKSFSTFLSWHLIEKRPSFSETFVFKNRFNFQTILNPRYWTTDLKDALRKGCDQFNHTSLWLRLE